GIEGDEQVHVGQLHGPFSVTAVGKDILSGRMVASGAMSPCVVGHLSNAMDDQEWYAQLRG
ncbi:hypothetical protein, partial [Pseudomonas aeruginosa]|uniref:hypothetical protein n=1 Tax=Pseudomonas aeruginosa TaxID=287 RepID=UPI0035931BB8